MTPQSELSYSYSEMVGDMEGSNFMTSKLKQSNGGYLKNHGQTTLGMSTGDRFIHTSNNYTIEEEDDDKVSSSN